ncbi:zinc finger protein 567-like [Mytilus trossulus]|uniref:zinc finger protein 567-like n=1 Tax=Mytilus trossulus TaxID=6551 RepID=UPI003004F8AA
MDEKVMCNRNDIQRSENLPDMQRKSILEIAGQQIIGDESGLSVEDSSSTDNNGQSSLREPQNVGKSVLELTTIFQIIENMCLKLNDYGEEFVMIMANPYKQTSNYIGSTEGRQFMKENTSVMQNFVKHCYNAACRLSALKSGQETNPNIAEEINSSEVKEIQGRKDQLKNSAIRKTTIEFSDNNSETNGFESDVTENYDMEKIVQNAVQVVDKNLDELKSIEEENTLTKSTPQNIKEYPHPKKRLTKMKAQEVDETNDSKTSKTILTEGNSETPLVNKKTSKSKCIGKSQKQDKKNVKNKNNKFECKTCFLMFDSGSLLKQHLVKHKTDTSTKIICSCCKKTFKTKLKLRKHMRTKHMKYPATQFTKKTFISLKCEKCGKVFHRQDTFKSHMKFHEAPKHKCQICDKAFYLKTNLSKHKKTHKKRLECQSCQAVFTDRENYELHNCQSNDPENFTRTYNSWVTEDGKHVCGICRKVFTKRRGLLTHRKLHSIICTSHVCNICNKSYKTRNSLNKHVKIVHSGSRDFVCDLCGKSFKQQDTLNVHMRTHDNNRTEYECKVCGKFLSAQGALKVHMRTHVNLKPHMCDVCGMSFSQRGNLAKHMLSHSNNANYRCEQCGKDFKYPDTWRTHQRSHALKAGLDDLKVMAFGKFYRCEVCEKKFASASQYKVHMRTHTNERPYPCLRCGKSFKESGKLARHMKTHKGLEHNEHNYISNSKDQKDNTRRRKDQRYVDIAIKPGYDVNLMLPQRNESLTMDNAMPSSNPNQNTDIGQLYPVQFTESSTFTDEVCSDTSSVINKGSQQAPHTGSPIRVIDDSRHQFLMHQLTPVTSLIMESADGQHIQLPNEMYVMQLGIPDDSHVTNPNLINPTQAYSPNNDVLQSNQTHNMHSYNKYL